MESPPDIEEKQRKITTLKVNNEEFQKPTKGRYLDLRSRGTGQTKKNSFPLKLVAFLSRTLACCLKIGPKRVGVGLSTCSSRRRYGDALELRTWLVSR